MAVRLGYAEKKYWLFLSSDKNILSDLTARFDAAPDEVAALSSKQPAGKDFTRRFGGRQSKDEKLSGVGQNGRRRSKEDNDCEALNKAFAEMCKDGTYDKLAKKYFDFNVTANNLPPLRRAQW